MRGFGFKNDGKRVNGYHLFLNLFLGFFVCTETTPRCYIIQEVTDVNQALDDINKGSGRPETSSNKSNHVSEMSASPHLPFLPW
jgi:hypothetical protein